MDLTAILFLVLAVVNGLPVVSALVPAQLSRLYGIAPDDGVQITLLQHRALLLGLVGAACVCAAYMEAVRWPVLVGVFSACLAS